MFKFLIFACFLAFAAAKPGVIAPLTYTAPLGAPAPAVYSAPIAHTGAYYAGYAAAAPYAYGYGAYKPALAYSSYVY